MGRDERILRKAVESITEASQLREENRILRTMMGEMADVQDMPLWRRIACQRLALREAYRQVDMYQRWWRTERARNDGASL